MQKYDVAAFVWPAYTGDEPRTRIFWPEGYGEWQTVKAFKPLFPGHVWPRTPRWGYVNEADPYVMEMEINAAADHGVNVFIYDWYWYDDRPFLEQCLNNGFLGAKNNSRMKFYLMWANHTARTTWDKRNSEMHTHIWKGEVNREKFEKIVNRIIEKYFCQPTYYKIAGKPVFMLYDVENLVNGLGGIDNTLRAIEYFREQTVKAGFPGLELQLTIRSRDYMKRMLDDSTDIFTFVNTAFDSVTHYQYCDFADMGRPYPEILEDVKREWAYIDSCIKPAYYPNVSVGWDENPRYNTLFTNIVTENTPENVKKAFELARNYVDTHKNLEAPLITVNSWNEWTETSYLHPDNIYGYGYLEAIRDVILNGK